MRNKNVLHGAKIFGVPLYSVHDAIADINKSGVISISYQGQKVRPEDLLATINPKRVFFCLGLNEVGYDGGVNWTIGNWGILIKNIRAKCPNIEIYIQSCTPIWIGGEKWGLSVQRIDQYNVKLEKFCKDNGCHFVNIAEALKDENGGLKTEYCSDKYIHLKDAGVQAWIKYLKTYAAANHK